MEISLSNLEILEREAVRVFDAVSGRDGLDTLAREWTSKEGILRQLFGQLRSVEPDQKPQTAARLNELKQRVEGFIAAKEAAIRSAEQSEHLKREFSDLSLPGRFAGTGSVHPLTRVERRIMELLRPFGFENVVGPEVETEYYCFDSLNIPPHHPARDMQDTFYTSSGHVLRTHTTSVQARRLQQGGMPVKIASFGRVFRNETEDASHQAMFHQFELVWIEEGLTLAHLMGIISHLLKGLYGKRRKVKFVPKYYPYTEPSLGPQIDCSLCHGTGCPACGGSGWVTIGGSGMIHRKVLEEFKYDPATVSGIAFGLGTSRLAGQFYGIPTLKTVYENDLRILGAVA